MKQILFVIFLLIASSQTILACDCFIQTYCDWKMEVVGDERALVFKGHPIKTDTLSTWIYAV